MRAAAARVPELRRRTREGFQSSLAAVTLQDLGFVRATDLAGGFQAWAAAGLPVLHEVARIGIPGDLAGAGVGAAP
jgi:hypothetical protein